MRNEILSSIQRLENTQNCLQGFSCREARRLLANGDENAAMSIIRGFKQYQTNNANYQYQRANPTPYGQ